MSGFNPFDQQPSGGGPRRPEFTVDKKKLKRAGRGLMILAALAVVALIAYSGVYMLDSGKVAVITTFGKYSRTEETPGLRFMIPFVEQRSIVDVSSVRRMEFGYRSGANARDVDEESTMLTGDECLVVADWTVQFVVSDSYAWLFHVDEPEETLRIISESCYRRVVASHTLDDILTDKKDELQREIMTDLQDICNQYGLGVRITAVQLQDAMPPEPVYDAFLDVTSAKEDKSAKINEAQKYANEKLPVARGDAEKLVLDAEAYKAERINEAKGAASRFQAIASEYMIMPEVTRTRLYLEMMQQVLPQLKEVVIVDKNGNTLQFLPIGQGQAAEKEGQ